MSGLFRVGDSVARNMGMTSQDNSTTSGNAEGASQGKVVAIYGEAPNQTCDVAYGDGSMASGIPMSDLNPG